MDFLKNALSDNALNADNIFVFFHQVLWWEPDNIYRNIALNSHEGRADTINFWTEVEPLFSSLSNDVYLFAGDVGAFPTGDEYMYHNYDNITLIASGMGGEERDNFVITEVKFDKTVDYRLITLNGSDINGLGKLEDYVLE